MSAPIRILLFSSLFPSQSRPIHGIFVETRLRELLKSGEVAAKVVAPVPWFPFRSAVFGSYGKMAATPLFELRDGIEVHHPRYFLPPKIGMNIAPDMMARAALPVVQKLGREGFEFDLIDAHYYYPDGVAASILAHSLNKPFVVTGRGTDLTLVPDYPRPRRRILETAAAASASIGVSRSLMDCLASLGADASKLNVLRNGVDLQRFEPMPRAEARRKLGLPEAGRLILSVGYLVERKGHHLAIEALASLGDDTRLVIAGVGEEKAHLETLARSLGLSERVIFAGMVPNTELKWYYSAADVLTLCSSREGWANVLLEAMACGTPVIATSIPGTTEVVGAPEAGILMRERSADALVVAWHELFAKMPSREAVRRYAEHFSWDATTRGQIDLFRRVLSARETA